MPGSGATEPWGTGKGLVVDDEPSLRDLHASWLADSHTVRTASTGRGALEALDGSFDFVLLDRRLPDMAGREVLAEIERRSIDCRVAMVTGMEPDFDVLEMGFDAYVTKPVAESELRGLVERLLRRSTYDEELREFYRLVEKRVLLEEAFSEATLARHEEYRSLIDAIERRRSSLRTLLDDLTHDDMEALIRQIGAGPREGAPSRRGSSLT